jgi:predicted DCC family thiol-disulfide oxidoreductase YuxK
MTLVVLYDADCGICQAARRFALQRDTAHRLRFAPYHSANLDKFHLTPAQASQSLYAVNTDGTRYCGARAVFEILRRLPGPWGLVGAIGALPPVSWAAEPVYRLVARHRAAISQRLGLSACGVDPTGDHPFQSTELPRNT